MISFVNAKINLGLNILSKRADGYHNLSTLFYPIGIFNGTLHNPEPFCDILEITRKDRYGNDEFVFSGNYIDCPFEKNLVVKALKAYNAKLHEKALEPFPVKISLDKHIPDGAGLGGGSADASFVLKALNSLYADVLTREELIDVAKSLGADCPFFIENRPVLAGGIGEVMKPYPLELSGYTCVVVKPDIYVSTKEAFEGITPREPERPIEDILTYPVKEWEKEGLKNDFETSIFSRHPELKEIKESLKDAGADYAAMSGSGSSLFGLFAGEKEARETFERYKERYKTFLIKL